MSEIIEDVQRHIVKSRLVREYLVHAVDTEKWAFAGRLIMILAMYDGMINDKVPMLDKEKADKLIAETKKELGIDGQDVGADK